jgi:hypothetical protein
MPQKTPMLIALLLLLLSPTAMAFNVSTTKATYAEGEQITVTYNGFVSDTDWITIVSQGTPTDSYGEWSYTRGSAWGSMTFKGLKPGTYEVRAYCCWQPGRPGHGGYNVKARHTFNVVGKQAGERTKGLCRDLRPGEPYYKEWSRCCDRADGKSDWTKRSTGKTSPFEGNCNAWGIVGD